MLGDKMPIINISFSEIKAEKKQSPSGKITISHNFSIVNLDYVEKNGKLVKVEFETKFEYKPNVGNIFLKGNLIYLMEEGEEDIVKKWKSKKMLDKENAAKIINPLISRCLIEALILCKEVGLPSPIKLPRIKVQ